MRALDYARLVSLAAIWGASFIFTRAVVPDFGAIPTAGTRVLIGGLVLLVYFRFSGLHVSWRGDRRHFLIIGVVNSAIPFALYGFAALHLPGSYLAIFNATAPLFGAACAAFWLADRFTLRKLAGLALGIAGVAMVAGLGRIETDGAFFLAVLACLGAAACYGIGGTYVRAKASSIDPYAVAGASQLVAGLALLPLFAVDQPSLAIGTAVAVNLLALAVLCSAIAYLIYYRLVADVGPSRAMTVSFLIPPFAMVWGALFLGEAITAAMVGGTLVVILGTLVVASEAPASSPGRLRRLPLAAAPIPVRGEPVEPREP